MNKPHLKWIAAAGLTAWGLSALAGQLPSRVRLLLLFAIGFGLLTGWGAGVLADEFGVRRSRLAAAITAALVIAGLANVAAAAYRQSRQRAEETVANDPQQLTALRVIESAMQNDPELQQRFREESARLQPDFSDYLMRRLLIFGHLPRPWPAVIWAAEVAAGAAASMWIFRRHQASTVHPPPQPIPES